VILLLLCTGCQGLQYQHDELLWTKQRWQDYKLSFPWAAFAKDRDAESVRQLEGPLHGFSVYSLNGPLLDAAEVERRIEEDSRRRAGGRGTLAGSGRVGSAAAGAAAGRCPPAAPSIGLPSHAAGAPGCSRAASSSPCWTMRPPRRPLPAWRSAKCALRWRATCGRASRAGSTAGGRYPTRGGSRPLPRTCASMRWVPR
jgi:hypothetical protein